MEVHPARKASLFVIFSGLQMPRYPPAQTEVSLIALCNYVPSSINWLFKKSQRRPSFTLYVDTLPKHWLLRFRPIISWLSVSLVLSQNWLLFSFRVRSLQKLINPDPYSSSIIYRSCLPLIYMSYTHFSIYKSASGASDESPVIMFDICKCQT